MACSMTAKVKISVQGLRSLHSNYNFYLPFQALRYFTLSAYHVNLKICSQVSWHQKHRYGNESTCHFHTEWLLFLISCLLITCLHNSFWGIVMKGCKKQGEEPTKANYNTEKIKCHIIKMGFVFLKIYTTEIIPHNKSIYSVIKIKQKIQCV